MTVLADPNSSSAGLGWSPSCRDSEPWDCPRGVCGALRAPRASRAPAGAELIKTDSTRDWEPHLGLFLGAVSGRVFGEAVLGKLFWGCSWEGCFG